MRTYKCEYSDNIDGKNIVTKIEAGSHREAYEKFLKTQGIHGYGVIVKAGPMDSGEYFNDHFKTIANKQAALARNQIAKKGAQESLSSTDMLLKELIVEQKRSNELLEKIRFIGLALGWWFIGSVILGVIIAFLAGVFNAIMG